MKSIGTSILNLGRVVALPLVGLALAAPAYSQGEDAGFLEEIVVTAQKREQNIMDVPVAITAVTGAQIEASGIKDMIDLQQNVPGLIVGGSQTTTTSNFSIRGIGSTSNNFGVESSVGLYVDGVYRSRQSSLINELVDVQSVEVLRGPQGTLFGKNTASGAITVHTVAPSTDGNDAFVEVTAGDYDLARIAAATNIVLSDNLAFRGTIFSSKRDGYVTDDNFRNQISTKLGPVEDLYNNRNRVGARMQLAYDNNDDLKIRVIADYAEIDEICCIGTSRVDSLFSRGGLAAGQVINGPDAILMLMGRTVYTDQNYPFPLPPNVVQASWDDYRTAVNFAPISQNEDRGISVDIDKVLGGGSVFTSITAYREFDTYDSIDADFTDTSIAERVNDASQQSFSQEFRLVGEFGDSSNWVAGAYYFAQDIESNTITVGGTELQTYADLGQAALGQPTLSDLTNGVTAISQGLAGVGIPFPPGAPGFPPGAFANDDVLQEHSGYAVYGQVDWALADAFELSLGARYTDETKDIDAIYTQTNPGTMVPDTTAIATTIFLFQQWAGGGMVGAPPDLTPLLAVAQPNAGWAAWTLAPFSPRPNVRETLKDDQVTGTIKGTWFINDDSMAYLSYSTGFKSGGTNTDRIWFYLPQLFNAETSQSIELGFKGDLGERFRVSAALYQTDFDDFQANSFTGTGFNLQNAGDLEIKGIELEWLWQPLDNTTVSGYFAHNEGEFNSFVLGTCWDAAPFHTLSPDPGLNPTTGTCSRSGEDIPYNPEDRFNLRVTQTFPVGNNEMFARAEYAWASESLTDGDNDPLTKMDDFGILNLRLGLNIESWNSSITLWGRNITDERYYGGSYDPPLLDTGRTNSYPSEPATYGITFRKNWD
jgi:iron complex outermembrane receptor protein